MFWRIASFILAFPLFGCGSKSNEQSTPQSDQGQRFQFHLGGSEDDSLRQLPFKIIGIYQNQEPSDVAPFHAAGGSWTFFDCQADGDVKFLVGTVTKTTDEGNPSHWGRAVLAVNDNDEGRRFVELFAKSFGGTISESSRQT